jgi:hypothetical protein
MKRVVLLSVFLTLIACGDDPQILKAGSKVKDFTMVEDAQFFPSMNECVEELKRKSTEEYSLTIKNDDLITPRMHVIVGEDAEATQFMNTCSEVDNSYAMRITKHD